MQYLQPNREPYWGDKASLKAAILIRQGPSLAAIVRGREGGGQRWALVHKESHSTGPWYIRNPTAAVLYSDRCV